MEKIYQKLENLKFWKMAKSHWKMVIHKKLWEMFETESLGDVA